MWLIKIVLLLNINQIYQFNPDQIKVTEVGIEIPIPYPRPLDDDEMLA